MRVAGSHRARSYRAGTLGAEGWVAAIVSDLLADKVEHYMAASRVPCNVLTGFKWIGDQIAVEVRRRGWTVIFGFL